MPSSHNMSSLTILHVITQQLKMACDGNGSLSALYVQEVTGTRKLHDS